MAKVSIIMPTYNCAKYIGEAIDSVLAQTFTDWELIIVDDGSTDNTKEVIEPYLKDERIRYVYQENRGLPGARNTGIKISNGEHIALLDADDEWPKDALMNLMQETKMQNCDWIVTNRLRVEREERRIIKSDILSNFKINDFNFILLRFLEDAYIFPEVGFFRKDCLISVGLYDESMLIYEDIDLHMRLLLNNKPFSYLPVPTYIYKIRLTSLTRQKAHLRLFYLSKFLRKYERQLAVLGKDFKEVLAYKWWDLGRQYWYNIKDVMNSLKCACKSLSYSYKPLFEFMRNVLNRG